MDAGGWNSVAPKEAGGRNKGFREDENQMRSGWKCGKSGAARQNNRVAGLRGESRCVPTSAVEQTPARNSEGGVVPAAFVEEAQRSERGAIKTISPDVQGTADVVIPAEVSGA
jgi:hypothetical protein